MTQANLFEPYGAHVLVDGQFGSCGKGALAAWLAYQAVETGAISHFHGVISSSGPNSGHTSYSHGQKIVLKQLPTFAVHAYLRGYVLPVYLSAGAVIDIKILIEEAKMFPRIPIYVHPQAAVVTEDQIKAEHSGPIAVVAGTRSGTGAALARKIERRIDAIWEYHANDINVANISTLRHLFKPQNHAYFIEVAQGFSLGINSEFYPKVTSRECTVMQAIADARIPPRLVTKTYMCIRTYPIRVGNVDGYSSGGWYPDQRETTWEHIGVEPELTTVTKRERRVATFSDIQLQEAIRANDPDWIAINFMNYVPEQSQQDVIDGLKDLSEEYTKPFDVIGGWGPNVDDWRIV
jgi:adenylosuccinate synthase